MNDLEKFISMLKHAGYVEGQDYEIILKDGYTTICLIDDDKYFDPLFTFVAPDWHLRDWCY